MKIFVGCSSSNNASVEYKNAARELAKIISKDNDLVYGADYNGIMGIFYEEFLKNNRKIYAVCYELYIDYLEKLKVHESYIVKTLGESNEKLIELADTIIFLPGGYGTLCELIYTLETKRTKNHNKKIIIFNLNNYFTSQLEMFNKAYSDNLVTSSYNELCIIANTVEEVVNNLK